MEWHLVQVLKNEMVNLAMYNKNISKTLGSHPLRPAHLRFFQLWPATPAAASRRLQA
jgi:hypothetical protein